MAVSFITSPYGITPSDNPIRWTFTSNQTGQANFSFIVEIYVNGALSSRREIFPEVGARAHIDIQDTMKNVTPVATPEHTTVVKNASNLISCYIKVRERYGATPAYQADSTSATVYAFKSSLTKKDFTNFDPANYEIFLDTALFMNYVPDTLTINHASDNIVSVYNNSIDDLAIVFNLYDANGSSITGADVAIPNTAIISQINLRSDLLISETPVTLSQFNQASYMQYYCEIGGGAQASVIKRVYFDQSDCGIRTHFVWLNKLGSFDPYTFTHNKIIQAKIESNTFEKQFGNWSGNLFSYDANDSGVIDFLKTTKSMMQVVSGYINQEMQIYLVSGMYTSPLVLISESGDFERMRVEATEYVEQNDEFEEEFTEIVTLGFPNIDYSQVL